MVAPEFDSIGENISHIAGGSSHLVALGQGSGQVYTCGRALYGNTGHGGSANVVGMVPVPAIRLHIIYNEKR